jgi:general secretion pathway protein D
MSRRSYGKPTMMERPLHPRTLALVAAALIWGCATPPPEAGDGTAASGGAPQRSASAMSPALAGAADRAQSASERSAADRATLYKGSGVLVKGQQMGGGLPPAAPVQPTGGGVVLNFEGADLREVVRNILGDILNANYTIDAAVGGSVTIRTASGIPREALPATLELLLRANGAAMTKEGDLYKIVPAAAVVRGNVTPQLGNSQRALPPGFSVQIVPLRYVGVREMVKILEPFARDAQAVRADELRNLMILSGTERELKHLLETIDMFDIDWMAGMSVGVFTLQNADVKAVMKELDAVIGDKATSPFGGILRIIPIERMNAVLIVTPQPAYLEEAKKWVERLDRGGGGDGVRFYVYHLQNTRADHLAPLLQQAFTGRVTQQFTPSAPTLAPGTQPGTIVNPPPFSGSGLMIAGTPQATATATSTATQPVAGTGAPGVPRSAGAVGDGLGIVRNVQVVADKDANTIMIIATPSEYAVIEAALKKLDIPSRQVMIEVVIADVTLRDEFQYGVEWYFSNGAKQAGGLFRTGTDVGNVFSNVPQPDAGIKPRVPGFNYLLSGAFPGGIQAAVSLLGISGNVKVVANPHVAALDNQKATIKVGNKIPISQQTIVGGASNAVVATSQYIDTGVLLAVTPRINQGGLVTLDVQAEVSIPGDAPCDQCAPPINSRSIQSLLGVQSGQTMVMGGLISSTKVDGSSGIPLLSKIPIFGGLFGTQTMRDDRTELVLFITPRVVETPMDIQGVVDDLRRRMERLDDVFQTLAPAVRPAAAPVAAPAPTVAAPPAARPAEVTLPGAAPQAGAPAAAPPPQATPPAAPSPGPK